jgi:hypothetical protein
MIFIPSLHKIPVMVPIIFWGAVYFALYKIVDRSLTASLDVEVIALEFIIIEVGVWLSYQLAVVVESSESLMDILAQGTFPYRAIEMDASSEQIKIEFGRSRRYHRSLSLLAVHVYPKDEEPVREVLKNLQQDVLTRLSNARIGQAIGETIRHTDILIRDHLGRFVILCPETNLESAKFLAERIFRSIEERTGLHVNCGVSSFPDEAITFEDLLYIARDRSRQLSSTNATTEIESQAAQ